MIIIGLTGGIASGKSTVSQEFRKMNIPVFDADEVSRQAVHKGSRGLELVVEALGKEYLTESGDLDRAKVAARVFKDKAALKCLESIIHGQVWAEAEAFLSLWRERGAQVVVLDVPLLLECGWQKDVDKVWLVAIGRQQQVERAMKRSGMSESEVTARINAQMSLEGKKRFADVIIDNSGSLENTLAEVHRELAKLGLKA